MTRRSAPEGASHSLAAKQDQGQRNARPFRYPGQARPWWRVLSELRMRGRLDDTQAAAVWAAFVGDRSADTALGELVHMLYERGWFDDRRAS